MNEEFLSEDIFDNYYSNSLLKSKKELFFPKRYIINFFSNILPNLFDEVDIKLPVSDQIIFNKVFFGNVLEISYKLSKSEKFGFIEELTGLIKHEIIKIQELIDLFLENKKSKDYVISYFDLKIYNNNNSISDNLESNNLKNKKINGFYSKYFNRKNRDHQKQK